MDARTSPDRLFRILFFGLSALLLLLMPILSTDHGMSGDEWSLIIYGNDIYDYFFKGSKAALDYDVHNSLQYAGWQYYGGLYDFTVTFLHKKLFPFTQEYMFRHIINALIGAGLFIYTGLVAKELGGWRSGLLALVFIALSPRLFGEGMNNPKDIPFAFANVFFLYYLLRFLRSFPRFRWKYTLLMGLGFGMAMGFRIGGLVLIPYFVLFTGVYYFFNSTFRTAVKADFNKHAKQIALSLVVLVALGYCIGIMFWPWALQDPLSRPLQALSEMTNRQIFIRVLFEGEYIMNNETPWYYTPKWIFISSPLWVLLCFLGSIAALKQMMKRYGGVNIFILFFTLLFPWFYAVYKNSTVYDTWRHFFFLYPSIALLAALFCNWVLEIPAKKRSLQYAFSALIVAGMALPLVWTVRNHPNEYVYFNELIGGPKGAYGQFDFDYYQNSGKQAADWIRTHGRKPSGRKLLVGSNMTGFDKYFARDSASISYYYVRYNERNNKDWDYYVTYSRFISVAQLGNNSWPPGGAVHTISAGDVPISAVLERKSNNDVLAYGALQRQHFDTAAALYQQYLVTDPNNDQVLQQYGIALASIGQLDGAVAALSKARDLDPTNPAIHQILAQVYSAKGDQANAQQAMNMARQLSEQ